MKIYKRITCVIIALILAFSCTGCTTKDGKQIEVVFHSDKKTVFKLGNMKCGIPEAKLYLMNTKNNYSTISGIDIWNGEFDEDVISASVKSMALSHLTRVYSLCYYAEMKGIHLTDTEAMMVRSAAAEYYASLTEDEKAYFDLDESQIADIYGRYALAVKMNDLLMDNVDEEVSDDEARVMSAMVIFVSSLDKANEIEDKLKNGYIFENQAASNTELDSYIVTFPRGTYPQNVENIIFNLDEKKASDKIEADNGYYFFYITSKYLEEESEENKETIRKKRRALALDEVVADVEKNVYSDFNENLWKTFDLKTAKNVNTNTMFTVLERYTKE